jgi:hypothetical protein
LAKSHFLISLENLEERIKQGPMTFGDAFQHVGAKGDEVLIIFLCLPFLQPIPVPFLSSLLGILICGAGILNFLNRPPWFPQKFKNKTLDPHLALSTVRVAEKVWAKVEKILHPRWVFLSEMSIFRFLNVLLIVSQGFLLSLPLPIPFSNTIPAIAIILNAIGQLEEDGLIIVLSYLVLLGAFSFFSGIAIGVGAGWDFLEIPS